MKILAAILEWTGILTILYTVIGLIAGLFGYKLVVEGTEFPLITLSLASILVPIGIILTISGWLLEQKIAFGKSILPPVLDINDLSFIEKAIQKTARRNLGVGLFLLIFGSFMMLVPVLDKKAGGIGVIVFVLIFAALLLFLGLFMMFKWTKQYNVKQSAEWQLIVHEPQKINEIKVQIFENEMSAASRAINVNFVVGKKIKATVAVNEDQLFLLKQYLLKVNPGVKLD